MGEKKKKEYQEQIADIHASQFQASNMVFITLWRTSATNLECKTHHSQEDSKHNMFLDRL